MTDVFLSYSRRDAGFVAGLVADLERRGKSVWIDVDGIEFGDVFPEAIRRAIEQADAFVFVITPDAAASRYCETEVEYALSLGKRLVPLLLEPVVDDALPDAIRVRHWIPFTPDADRDVATAELVKTIERDLEHVRAHTRWLARAREWESSGRDRSLLARGSELVALEAWLAGAGGGEPAPTELQRDFAAGGRAAASRRQRLVAGASVAVAVLSLVLLGFALVSRDQAKSEAAAARSRAVAQASEVQLAVDPERSILLAMAALRTSPTREAVFALRHALDESPLRLRLPRVGLQQVQLFGPGIAYSPDGRRLAVGSQDGSVRIFASGNGRLVRRIRVGSPAPIVQYSPDGSLLAVATSDDVQVLDASTGARRILGKGIGSNGVFAFSRDSSLLYFSNRDRGRVVRWNVRTRRVTYLHKGTIGTIGAEFGLPVVALSPDGRRLAVGGWPGVALLDAGSGRVLATALPRRTVSWLAFGPDGSLAAAYGGTSGALFNLGAIVLLDGRTLRLRKTLARVNATTFLTVAFSPDGTKLAYGAGDGTAGVRALPSGQLLLTLPGHTTNLYQIAFSPDGRDLATAASDGNILIWRVSGNQLSSIRTGGFDNTLNANDTPADLRLLDDRVVVRLGAITGAERGHEVVESWTRAGAQRMPPLAIGRSHPDALVRLSPDGRFAISVGAGAKTLQVWDVRRRRARTVKLDRSLVVFVAPAFSPDNRHAAFAVQVGANQALELLDLATGHFTRLDRATPCGWLTSGFSRDGRYLAGGSGCGQVDIWDTTTGHSVGHEVTFAFTVNLLAPTFSPDGSRLAIANTSNTGQVSILDIATGKTFAVLTAHTGQVEDISYSPDGTLLATASIDETVRIWNARTGQPLRILQHRDAVDAVAFGADSRTVASFDYAGTIRIWDACSDCNDATALMASARRRVTRALSPLERTEFGVD